MRLAADAQHWRMVECGRCKRRPSVLELDLADALHELAELYRKQGRGGRRVRAPARTSPLPTLDEPPALALENKVVG